MGEGSTGSHSTAKSSFLSEFLSGLTSTRLQGLIQFSLYFPLRKKTKIQRSIVICLGLHRCRAPTHDGSFQCALNPDSVLQRTIKSGAGQNFGNCSTRSGKPPSFDPLGWSSLLRVWFCLGAGHILPLKMTQLITSQHPQAHKAMLPAVQEKRTNKSWVTGE